LPLPDFGKSKAFISSRTLTKKLWNTKMKQKIINKNNFFIKSQIETNIRDVINFINSGVFNASVLKIFQEPVFISIIIKLDDLLQKFRILEHRINFNDDIISGDVTDLVNKIRNAICHLNSPENILDRETQTKFVFNILIGKVNALQIDENIVAKSDYEDDIAFYYGSSRIYLKRHVIRVLNEAEKVYYELYGQKLITF